MAVFILEDALSVWTNLAKHLLLDALCVSSIKTGTRRIIRLDELSFVVRLERRTTDNASNNKFLPKFVQTDNASSSIKMTNVMFISSQNQRPLKEVRNNFKNLVLKAVFDPRKVTHHCHRAVSGTVTYKSDRYVPRQRVCFLSRFACRWV